jgi:hypothetical protein
MEGTQQNSDVAKFRGPKKKLRYNHNLLYKDGNMLRFYGLGFNYKFVITVNLLYPCSLYSSFTVILPNLRFGTSKSI